MKEKIAIEKWRPKDWLNPCVSLVSMSSNNPEGRAFEAGADSMFTAITEEIEKVENPYDFGKASMHATGFAVARNKILALLK